MSRSTSFFTALLSAVCLLAPVAIGCSAAATDDNADSEESVEETSADLTSTASTLVGHYYTHQNTSLGIARLTLNKNGKYTASVEATNVVCIQSPCLVPESGSWNATKKAGGGLRLRLRATGQASRYYDATLTTQPNTLTITRGGQSESLYSLATNQCLDDADCGANEACGPKMCLMWCEVNDPFCCGPSTCEPKPPPPPPPPPPSCGGAWLDQNGLCRTPADGVYPQSCCEKGPECGNTTCGFGDVCCNPLSGICTKPGMFCAM